MASKLNPYIGFKDNTREAMEFYKTVFGGVLELRTFKEYNATQNPSEENNIMHSVLTADNGMTIMAADAAGGMDYKPGANISISVSGDDEDELRGYFNRLSDGGTITVPMEKAPWGDVFGMCTDKFNISWLFNVAAPTGVASEVSE